MKVGIGRYLNGNSIIHKLDARVKLFATTAFVVLFFLADTFLIQFFLLLPLLIAFIITTKKPLKLLSMLKSPLWIGIFLFAINCVILNIGSNDIIYGKWWIFTLSKQIILTTCNVTLRIFSIILAITVFTLSTKPVLLTKSLEFYFYPLKLIKIPVDIFVTIITISLRFIPTLLDEANRILKAQASRGVDFKNGSLKSKTKATVVLIVPLFVSAFAKADDLANAMETRGYDPYAKRVSYRKWSQTWWDILFFLIVVGLIVVIALIYNGFFIIPNWFIPVVV
ncbi:MAG: energy-coupling factor transporter transmembrane component T family protein [Metamycoplasmataceae bacterium]